MSNRRSYLPLLALQRTRLAENKPETTSFAEDVRQDFRRHGGTVLNAAFLALLVYRIGRWASQRRYRPSRYVAQKIYGVLNKIIGPLTRIWIPPQTTLGEGFHIIHAEGSLSIHPDTVIGKRCGVMHNVTIGTNMRGGAPVIGDDVFIGVNSTVLGPIKIGDRVRIAANTAVTTDIPSDSVAVGSPARIYPRLGLAAGPKSLKPERDLP